MSDMNITPSQRFQRRLLAALLERGEGWSEADLAKAAEAAGLNPGEAGLAAPNGAIDLIEAFAGWADREMEAGLAAAPLSTMKIRARVTLGVRLRLEALAPHKEMVRRGALLLARPANAPAAARIGWRTADAIWRALGDASTDENYYTKRLILSGVHAATLARWLADDSPGLEPTWAFLDRRIEGVMTFEKLKARFKPISELGPAVVGALARLRYR